MTRQVKGPPSASVAGGGPGAGDDAVGAAEGDAGTAAWGGTDGSSLAGGAAEVDVVLAGDCPDEAWHAVGAAKTSHHGARTPLLYYA
jgi:hypothetical protein